MNEKSGPNSSPPVVDPRAFRPLELYSAEYDAAVTLCAAAARKPRSMVTRMEVDFLWMYALARADIEGA